MTDQPQWRLAYFAGLIDAIGHINTFQTEGGTELPRISVSSPNREILNMLAFETGTKPFDTTRVYDRHRCAEHCTVAHDHIVSRSARWSVSGAKATIMLVALEPYLVLKKTVAHNVAWIGLRASRKPATLRKMAAMGWPLPEVWDDREPIPATPIRSLRF